MHYDIIIIGAGPAGLMAARELKKQNINFLIIDSKKEIGLPLRCGEGIREKEFIEFFETKDFPFVKNTINLHEVHYADLIKTFQENFLELDRPRFEKWLSNPIKENLKLSTLCRDIEIKQDQVEIKTDNQTLTAKLAILAYGCSFNIQNKLKLIKEHPIKILGYGGIYKNYNLDKNKFYYFFDEEHLGYLWIFPKDKNLANIGFGAFNTNKKTRETLNKLLKKYKINAIQISEYAGIVPCSGPIKQTYTDRLLICGNAAGQVHAFSGEGIYYGLKAGQLAAKTAVKAVQQQKFNENFLKNYEKSWKKEIGRNMQSGIIEAELFLLAFKHKKIKNLFNAPTEKELKGMMLEGKVPLRARFAWKLARHFNLLEKEELPLTVNLLYKIYKFFKR